MKCYRPRSKTLVDLFKELLIFGVCRICEVFIDECTNVRFKLLRRHFLLLLLLMLLLLSFSFIVRLLGTILHTVLLFSGLMTITCEMTFSSTVEAFKLRLVKGHCVDIHWFSLIVILRK